MRRFSRFFVPLLFISLLSGYVPMAQAEIQQQDYANTAYAPLSKEQPRSYGGKVGRKALSAFANLTGSVLEIPKNIINTSNKSNIFYGLVGGSVKGLVNMLGRMGVGVADLLTVPLPTQPIAYPVYIWDDFDQDTSYGPVFRLDESPKPSKPMVTAPK
ncbi:MAG: exosortase system-associated protein, TIGR04073 family [Methylobacter sp.]|nr:exosortase system-associated protein, TIGR04073 family [Methylobacter sp.]